MKQALPLVKLSLLRPFVQELRDRRIDPEPIFGSVGLTEEATLDPDLSVHAMVVHQFTENAATATGDRHLGAQIGSRMTLDGWPVLKRAEARAVTVGDYLSIFISSATEVASSATEYLHLNGASAVFGERRAFKPTIVPAQNDAFMGALGWAILRRALGNRLDPSRATITVSDPKALPTEYDLLHPIKGDRMGFSIRFPSAWLSTPFDAKRTEDRPEIEADLDAADFVRSFRQMVRSHIGQGKLTATECARLASMSHQKLKRRLAEFDTDISSEIDFVAQEYARLALLSSNRSISDIANALGYTDAANFARAFRRLNGVSPSRFRGSQKAGDDQEE
ncbi:helix-turn-helix domain-containing protein [Tropicimonas sp. TH_r6]|uniref:helix-turn-helix domain-containing protein n=1 Tax=Tropicimonas sp. TH_r6 TaxID=3082085 RepID=UPI00295500E8|nr:helix-turn-helix domain-containing protein [Tropicimonas sp. TH_r6]MDV7143851.1 helix-turn-helix domain-containing protein [Tropicimonas sp. TH_r6]